MLKRSFTLNDRYWAVTAGLLSLALPGGMPAAIYGAMVLCVVQIVHYRILRGSMNAFPVQVRVAYLGLLAAGLVPGLAFIHWIQFFGTWSAVIVDYCPLARMMSLTRWNRDEGLSARLLVSTVLTPPSAWRPPRRAAAYALRPPS